MTIPIHGETAPERLGSRVRTLRAAHHWTQAELAERAGMDRTYIGSIERGERNVALENLRHLAEAFGMSLAELLTGV